MFAYLQHQQQELEKVRGVLIYLYNGHEFQEDYRWDDRRTMEIMTIDLRGKWDKIKETLIQLLAC
ncbi:hypothetical protein [Pseudogracilibacillus sp. SO30301A]|uniref:hypothetical protein n=1 Tax=Pseudogracilibacillus sp. SO30301A TaxID=3098291 RepID=UPI00300E334F